MDTRIDRHPAGQLPWFDRWTCFTDVHWLVQTADDVPAGDDWLSAAERETLAGLHVSKRRRDWRLGRWTVKQALARLSANRGITGARPRDFVVDTEASGAPYASSSGRIVPWPISISHSHGRGLCAIGPSGTAIGCDIERVEPRTDDFATEWFTPSEQHSVTAADAAERHHIVTLFWSGKESALKAARTGLAVSTHDVTVTAENPRSGDDWGSLCINRQGDSEPMRGWWRRDAEDLITVVTVPALGRPVALSSYELVG